MANKTRRPTRRTAPRLLRPDRETGKTCTRCGYPTTRHRRTDLFNNKLCPGQPQ